MICLFIMHNLPRNYLKPVISLCFSKTIQRNSFAVQRYHVHVFVKQETAIEEEHEGDTGCVRLRQNSFNFQSIVLRRTQHNTVWCVNFIVCKHLLFVHNIYSHIAIANEMNEYEWVHDKTEKKNWK